MVIIPGQCACVSGSSGFGAGVVFLLASHFRRNLGLMLRASGIAEFRSKSWELELLPRLRRQEPEDGTRKILLEFKRVRVDVENFE